MFPTCCLQLRHQRSEFLGRWWRKHKTSESSELHLATQLPRSQQCGAGLQQARSTRALLGSGSRRITHDTLVEAIPIIRTPLLLPQPCGRFHAAFARAVSSEGEEAARGSKVEVSLVTRHRDGKREHAGAEQLHPREEDGRGHGARQRWWWRFLPSRSPPPTAGSLSDVTGMRRPPPLLRSPALTTTGLLRGWAPWPRRRAPAPSFHWNPRLLAIYSLFLERGRKPNESEPSTVTSHATCSCCGAEADQRGDAVKPAPSWGWELQIPGAGRGVGPPSSSLHPMGERCHLRYLTRKAEQGCPQGGTCREERSRRPLH